MNSAADDSNLQLRFNISSAQGEVSRVQLGFRGHSEVIQCCGHHRHQGSLIYPSSEPEMLIFIGSLYCKNLFRTLIRSDGSYGIMDISFMKFDFSAHVVNKTIHLSAVIEALKHKPLKWHLLNTAELRHILQNHCLHSLGLKITNVTSFFESLVFVWSC